MIDIVFEKVDDGTAAKALADVKTLRRDVGALRDPVVLTTANLPFYNTFKLYRLRSDAFCLYFLHRPDDVEILDWTNQPIYRVNARAPLILNSANCIQYVRFFFSFVIGDFGHFVVVDYPEDMPWSADASMDLKASVNALINPATYDGVDITHFFAVRTIMLFKRMLLRVHAQIARYDFELYNDVDVEHFCLGQIRLCNEELLADNISFITAAPAYYEDTQFTNKLSADMAESIISHNVRCWLGYLRSFLPPDHVGGVTQDSKMLFYKEERTALFIDGVSVYNASKALGFDIDFKRLFEVFAGRGRLLRAFYYALILQENSELVGPLVDWLNHNGYTVSTKRIEATTDDAGRTYIKENMHFELAIDSMQLADRLEHVVIFSGDEELCKLVSVLQSKALRVSVVSTTRTSPPAVSSKLRSLADNYIDLYDLIPHIARSSSKNGDGGK